MKVTRVSKDQALELLGADPRCNAAPVDSVMPPSQPSDLVGIQKLRAELRKVAVTFRGLSPEFENISNAPDFKDWGREIEELLDGRAPDPAAPVPRLRLALFSVVWKQTDVRDYDLALQVAEKITAYLLPWEEEGVDEHRARLASLMNETQE